MAQTINGPVSTTSTEVLTVAFDPEANALLDNLRAELEQARAGQTAQAAEAAQFRADFERMQAAYAVEEARRQALELDARRTRFVALAGGWYAAPQAVGLLEDLAGAFGEESPQVVAFVEREKAHATQSKTSALFNEVGTDAPAAQGDAVARFNARVAQLGKERGLNGADAFNAAMAEDETHGADYLAAVRAR